MITKYFQILAKTKTGFTILTGVSTFAEAVKVAKDQLADRKKRFVSAVIQPAVVRFV